MNCLNISSCSEIGTDQFNIQGDLFYNPTLIHSYISRCFVEPPQKRKKYFVFNFYAVKLIVGYPLQCCYKNSMTTTVITDLLN